MRLTVMILGTALGAFAVPALAAPACSPPPGLMPAPAIAPPPGEVVTGVTNAYYLLALNWTPQWCRAGGSGARADEMECGRPFGFTLHGLWPNGVAKPYPRFCRPVGGIDAATVRAMYCRTPSPTLMQHEWQAHGSCGWADPKRYFAQAARLYDRLALPKIEAIPPGRLTAGAVRAAFVARNPALRAEAVYVQTAHDGALSEVRLCYDLGYRPAACPGGTGAPDGTRLSLAPSLTGAF
jgi:ribonuclease T2